MKCPREAQILGLVEEAIERYRFEPDIVAIQPDRGKSVTNRWVLRVADDHDGDRDGFDVLFSGTTAVPMIRSTIERRMQLLAEDRIEHDLTA